MKHGKTIISVYGWLIISMILLYLSGGDRPLEFAVWFSPIFLLRFFREVKLWKAVIITLPLMILVTFFADRGILPIPVIVIVILLTAINSATGLIPYCIDRLLNHSLPKGLKTLLFPTVAVAVEVFITSNFTGGTWGNPVYGIENLAILQLVSVTGIWGVMFIIYWTASVFNEVWEHRHQLIDIRKTALSFISVLVVVYGFGLWRLHHEKPVVDVLRVAGVTPGPEHRTEMMEIFGKLFSPKRNEIFNAEVIRTSINEKFNNLLVESSRLAESGVEMVVWSEAATFVFEKDKETHIQSAVQSAQEHKYFIGIALAVLKDNCLDLVANDQPFMENKLLFISSDGDIVWDYSKMNLAPGYESAMTFRGDGIMKSYRTAKGKITGAICYDMDFPGYIRQSSTMKSDVLIAPSNDWLEIKNTHTKMARLRAIENGISLLRPASSGISIATDPYGNIVSCVDDFESNGAPLVAVLPIGSIQTLYAKIGDFWMWICTLGGIVLVVLGIIQRINVKKNSLN